MIKLMFLDYRDFEFVDGFQRKLEPPRKFPGNPIMVSDGPWDHGYMSLYGSVMRVPKDGLWRMWYTTHLPKTGLALAYAESDDGLQWRRPRLKAVNKGVPRTNIVFDRQPHGAALIYDEREERIDSKYKMLAGASPSNRICIFRSPDGIQWQNAAENPVIGTHPDCPLGFHRGKNGRYVAYHRPGWGDRRVARSESWDLRYWSEAKTVVDREVADRPQTQFYGMGAFPYGDYEIGTLWVYLTEESDMGFWKKLGHQQPELTYTRTGYAWRRAQLGAPWIALAPTGSWDCGGIQPASQPVFLQDEIRFYYAASRTGHGGFERYLGSKPRSGIGFACMKPDRFVSISAAREGRILTRPIWTGTPQFYLNAATQREGHIEVEIDDILGKPIKGFEMKSCVPFSGNATRARIEWRNNPDPAPLIDREIRMRVRAAKGKLYSLFAGSEAEAAAYWNFRIPNYMTLESERERM